MKRIDEISDSELLVKIDMLIGDMELYSVSVALYEQNHVEISNRIDEFKDALEAVKLSISRRRIAPAAMKANRKG